MTTGPASQVSSDGLSNVANSIRRSMALFVAMSVSPEGTTDEELFAKADKYAIWINGRAGALAQEQKPEQPLGLNPWEQSP